MRGVRTRLLLARTFMQARSPIRLQQKVLADQDRGKQVAGYSRAKATPDRRLESAHHLGVRDEKQVEVGGQTPAIS